MSRHLAVPGSTGFRRLRSLLSFRHQNPLARLVSVVAAFATAMLLIGAGAAYTGAYSAPGDPACPRPGGFEIDGDMAQNTCDPSGDDWGAHTLTPTGDVDATAQVGTYSTSGKDNDDPTTWSSSGATPDKTDFNRAYATSKTVDVGGHLHYFVYVAWERSSTTGTQGYAIEIDNAAARTGGDGTPQPDRSHGTAVVYISSQGAKPPVFDEACTFISQATYGQTCTASNANVTFAINTADITDPLNADTTQAAGSFFEVALDVTGLTGIEPSCPGAAANSVYLRSITGQTHNGNLKGYMAPLTVAPDSTCVAPHIDTDATPGGNQVALGSSQTDVATVGVAGKYGVGDVAFYLCSPAEVTANNGDCSADGTLVSTNSLNGSGQATSDPVSGAATGTPGTYCWRAEFTPGANDHNYLPGTHTNNDSECFTVIKNSPSITTQIDVTGTGLGFATLGDTATLDDFFGDVTDELVTFKLYGPYADGVTPDCSVDDVVAGATNSSALNGSGVATSATYKPAAAGTYIWIASYPGDSNNNPIAGTCAEVETESTTIGGVTVSVAKSANPVGPVSAGTSIGFDVTVTNDSNFPATGVNVTDPLPTGADGVSGGDLNWSLPPGNTDCTINGDPGSQELDCTFSQVAPGSLPAIHITSATTPKDCGVVSNQATVTTTNGTGGHSAVATVSVLCPHVTFTKTADAASVTAGGQIGFTVTASNAGGDNVGTATGVVIDDPLPAGTGIDWSIAPGGPGNCTINGAPPAETLHCTAVDLAAGHSESVHVVSATNSVSSCATYLNVATLTATNAPTLTASASTQVVNCVVVLAPVQQPHPHVLPNTGGPNVWLFGGGLAMLLAGSTLVLTDQRRRRRS